MNAVISIPEPWLPAMTLRAAAVVPPIAVLVAPARPMPKPRGTDVPSGRGPPLTSAEVPLGLVPIKFPSITLLATTPQARQRCVFGLKQCDAADFVPPNQVGRPNRGAADHIVGGRDIDAKVVRRADVPAGNITEIVPLDEVAIRARLDLDRRSFHQLTGTRRRDEADDGQPLDRAASHVRVERDTVGIGNPTPLIAILGGPV